MSTVLIAEDEEALLSILAEVVAGLGHRVLRAADGEDALTLARAQPPDLVITDDMMPRRTGTELLRALRDEPGLAGVPVILLSAARPRAAGHVWRFLSKPLRLAELEAAVTEAVGVAAAAPAGPVAATPEPGPALDLDETVNWLAHELKSPISSAQLVAQVLLRRLAPEAEQERRAVEVILRQLDRVGRFVSETLDAARLREGRLELDLAPLALGPWLEGQAGEWRRQHPGLELSLSLAPEPVTVRADPARLGQLLGGLVANACVHGRSPAASPDALATRVDVRLELAPGLARVHVRDHGPGIPADEMPRVFQRFHRAPGGGPGGHGLGLFIAAGLARLHGGHLDVRSELGAGATFTLALPRSGP
ncbi:MAG: hybrid sensor histidine kinase/response regulator [Planctomycetes bacterium]|nr:hybrid sensor histidine kinase/response regulator [Planctomycetota bacterium]